MCCFPPPPIPTFAAPSPYLIRLFDGGGQRVTRCAFLSPYDLGFAVRSPSFRLERPARDSSRAPLPTTTTMNVKVNLKGRRPLFTFARKEESGPSSIFRFSITRASPFRGRFGKI
uniref:MSP domain-containing protein n=1 Tax=Steinernema glaseri TaxID=37863 RepID=A0A1I7ZGI0_9BILA